MKAHKSHKNHSSINDSARCQYRTTKGRCTMLAVDPKRQLCFDHARQALKLHQEADFAQYLTKEAAGFQTAVGINRALGDLYVLLAQGHITPRRAAVLAHISSLLLRTLPAIDTDKCPDADRDLTPYQEGHAGSPDGNSPDAQAPATHGSAGLPCSAKGILLAPPQATQNEVADDQADGEHPTAQHPTAKHPTAQDPNDDFQERDTARDFSQEEIDLEDPEEQEDEEEDALIKLKPN